jgi:hypothetical protein
MEHPMATKDDISIGKGALNGMTSQGKAELF